MKSLSGYNITEFINEMLEPLNQIEAEAIDMANNLESEEDKIESLSKIQGYICEIMERVK